jgi:hypothetical protein
LPGRMSLRSWPFIMLLPPRGTGETVVDTNSHSNAHGAGFVVGPSLRCGSPLHAGVSGNASSPRPIFSEGGPSLRCGSPLHAGVSGNASSPRPIFSKGGPSLRCGSPLHAGVSGNASSPRPIFSEGGPSTYHGVRLRRLLLAAL